MQHPRQRNKQNQPAQNNQRKTLRAGVDTLKKDGENQPDRGGKEAAADDAQGGNSVCQQGGICGENAEQCTRNPNAIMTTEMPIAQRRISRTRGNFPAPAL